MTTNKSHTAPPTWASIEESLPPEMGHEDREALRRLTAPARHAWRCQQTVVAGLSALGDRAEHALVAALIALDLHGVGGPSNAGGAGSGTLRARWARSLGKGRWQASDGGAWRAAAESSLLAEVALETEARSSLPEEARGVLVEEWHAGVPVLAPSVIYAALQVEDPMVWSQARGYALHRMAERVARGEPVTGTDGRTAWQDVVVLSRAKLDALVADQATGSS